MHFELKKGLNLPLAGAPQALIEPARAVRHVALLGADYVDLKPSFRLAEGAPVRCGQTLFVHKQWPQICFTAPGGGKVAAIHRGERRKLLSVVIELDEEETFETFPAYKAEELSALRAETVRETLLASGLWTAFRTRPYSKIPAPDTLPAALFVTAMDTRPLAADPAFILAQPEQGDAFAHGLRVLARLTDAPIWVCTSPAGKQAAWEGIAAHVKTATFTGPHPAGLVGTHIHFLHPASAQRTVWHIGYADVIAIGQLFRTGRLPVERIVALGGAGAARPRLLRTRLGASLDELLHDEVRQTDTPLRVLSGSALDGRSARGHTAFLGRYHQQITLLPDEAPRDFLGWINPLAGNRFSLLNIFLPRKPRPLALNTAQNGSPRAMIPTGLFEEVMPLDILPTQLLRALLVGDTDMAQKLGCLELDEEDLALCSFVCVGKHDYAPILRENLRQIEQEG